MHMMCARDWNDSGEILDQSLRAPDDRHDFVCHHLYLTFTSSILAGGMTSPILYMYMYVKSGPDSW